VGGVGVWRLGWAGCVFAIALPLVWSYALLARWLFSLGLARRAVHATLLSLALASPLMAYATLFFGHGLAAACSLAAFALLATGPSDSEGDQRATAGARWAGGLVAGFMGLVDTPCFILAALLCLYALGQPSWSRGDAAGRSPGALLARLRYAAPVIAGVALATAAQLAYNHWVLGDPWSFTYQYKRDEVFAEIMASGAMGFALPSAEALWGLTFGHKRGVFYHAPWLLFAVIGLVRAARSEQPRARRDGRWLLGITAGYFLLISGFVDWTAGDAAFARHLLPAVSLLAVGLAWAWPRDDTPPLPAAVVYASVIIGFFLHASAVVSWPYHFAVVDMPAMQLSWGLVVQESWAPSAGRLLGMSDAGSMQLWLAAVLGCWVWSWLLLRRAGERIPARARSQRVALGMALTTVWFSLLVTAVEDPPERAVQVGRFNAQRFMTWRAE
jgi:hypothetical protein